MKKNEQLRLATGSLLAGLTLLLPACSVRKQQEKSTRHQEDTYLLHTDSLLSTNKLRIENECIRQWEMVCFSPPDSTGKQHVSAIIRSRDSCHSRSLSEDSLRRHSIGCARKKEESQTYDKREKQQTPTSVWKWVAGVILLAGGIIKLCKGSLRNK